MEEIYKPKHFHCTDNINLKEYFTEYSDHLLDEQKFNASLNDKILSFLNDDDITPEHLSELNTICSIRHLTVTGEQKQVDVEHIKGMKAAAVVHHPGEITDEARTLHTIKNLEERQQKKNDTRFIKELKERTIQVKDNKPEGKGNSDLKLGESVVISVRFFRPFQYHFNEPISFDAFKFDQEITLLGDNTLADLRDKIKCNSDIQIFQEESDEDGTPHEEAKAEMKQLFPSGFIFIDGIFYNDFRSKDAIDYSEVIRKWADNKRIGNFGALEMEKTKLISLSPRFGYPYVYQHQGRCEHLFIFSHAKLINATDPLESNCYPYHSDIGSGRVVYCFICGMSLPVWVVAGYDRLPQSKTPLCNDCFTSYCFMDGKKIGDFKTYPYVSRNAMF